MHDVIKSSNLWETSVLLYCSISVSMVMGLYGYRREVRMQTTENKKRIRSGPFIAESAETGSLGTLGFVYGSSCSLLLVLFRI